MRPPVELDEELRRLENEFAETITRDGLTADFTIFQRRRGHRHSTDDLLTAWYAATHAAPPVTRMLDLGSGIGSVGLSVAWRFPKAHLVAIEVQNVSFRFLRANVWANEVEDRVRIIRGDLRDVAPELATEEPFDLVTGSPPYFDVSTGIVSADSQRAAARFELHGDVRDYARAAVRLVRPGGRFVFCFPTVQRERAEQACARADLTIVATRDVIPKEGTPALFSLFACAKQHNGEEHGETLREPPLVVRDRAGAHTPEMLAARASFGMSSIRSQ